MSPGPVPPDRLARVIYRREDLAGRRLYPNGTEFCPRAAPHPFAAAARRWRLQSKRVGGARRGPGALCRQRGEDSPGEEHTGPPAAASGSLTHSAQIIPQGRKLLPSLQSDRVPHTAAQPHICKGTTWSLQNRADAVSTSAVLSLGVPVTPSPSPVSKG